MKLEKLRAHKRHSRRLEGIFSRNPVFICGLALPFAVMISSTLKASVAVSILIACSTIPTVLLASLIGRRIPQWISVILYALFSMALVIASMPLILPISPEITDSLGIYIPIVSLNTIVLTLCERHAQNKTAPVMALIDSLTYSLGFAIAVCSVAAVRELFGNNSLWGVPIYLPIKISGLHIAFSGFILTAFFSALYHFIKRCIRVLIYRGSVKSQKYTAH